MIIFSDMDGTFLTSDKRMSHASCKALSILRDAGVEFVPCTGRPLSGIPSDVLAHPAVHYAVSANGAVVAKLDPHDSANTHKAQIVMSSPLDRVKALAIWEIARNFDVTFDIFADGTCFQRRDLHERLHEFVQDEHILYAMLGTRVPVDEQPEETIHRVNVLERVAMYWKSVDDRDAILGELTKIDGIEVTRSYHMNIEVMEAGTSKGSALLWLCQELGIDPRDAIAFGDNMNDIPMLQVAGTGVAMANAEAPVRKAANAVTADNDHDGVAQFIFDALG